MTALQHIDAIKDVEDENRHLWNALRTFKDNAMANAAALNRLHQHELALLDATSLQDLLKVFVFQTARDFHLDMVSLAFEQSYREIRRVFSYNDSQNHGQTAKILFDQKLTDLAPCYKSLARPYAGPYQTVAHRHLFPQNFRLRSVALLPLRQGERLIGGLSLGSENAERFTYEHGTDYLDHFSRIGAVCLENALNRERLVQTTFTDTLTGCHNRRYLEERLQQELARAQRYRHPMCCMFFDLDYFKSVNDKYGHLVGDNVLIEFARRLKKQLRVNDIVVRYGGEEFAALLPETDLRAALVMAERIRQAIRKPMLLDQQVLNITVSIGVSEFTPRPRVQGNLQTLGSRLLAAADEALYQAKAEGRNRVVQASASIAY